MKVRSRAPMYGSATACRDRSRSLVEFFLRGQIKMLAQVRLRVTPLLWTSRIEGKEVPLAGGVMMLVLLECEFYCCYW